MAVFISLQKYKEKEGKNKETKPIFETTYLRNT